MEVAAREEVQIEPQLPPQNNKKKRAVKKMSKTEIFAKFKADCQAMNLKDLAALVSSMHVERAALMRKMAGVNRKYRAALDIIRTMMESSKICNINVGGSQEIVLCEKKRHCMITEGFLRNGLNEFLGQSGVDNDSGGSPDQVSKVSDGITQYIMDKRKTGKVTKSVVIRTVKDQAGRIPHQKNSKKRRRGDENGPGENPELDNKHRDDGGDGCVVDGGGGDDNNVCRNGEDQGAGAGKQALQDDIDQKVIEDATMM